MNMSVFEVSPKVCITILVKRDARNIDAQLGTFISSKLDEADIYREHLNSNPARPMDARIIRQSYFVSSREAAGWYYTMFAIAQSQKDKAIKLFNRYGVVISVDEY